MSDYHSVHSLPGYSIETVIFKIHLETLAQISKFGITSRTISLCFRLRFADSNPI